MKTVLVILALSVAAMSSTANARPVRRTASPPILQTGLYYCGTCRLALQQIGNTITVTPGPNCGPYPSTADYARNEADGRYFISYRLDRYYRRFAVYMKPTSSTSYHFIQERVPGKILCVKL